MTSSSARSGSAAESTVATRRQWSAGRRRLRKLTVGRLSRKMANPDGRRMRSISRSKSSGLHPFLPTSDSTSQACRRSYVLGYVEYASHLSHERMRRKWRVSVCKWDTERWSDRGSLQTRNVEKMQKERTREMLATESERESGER